MSKIIWESDTDQGIICESHITAIESVGGEKISYVMFDADDRVYDLSEQEFEQISGQIDHENFIYLEAAGTKLWINKEHFTDAVCNDGKCKINGWDVHPLMFAELMKYIKVKHERKMTKKAAHKSKEALKKTPEGLLKLIDKEKLEHTEEITKLKEQYDFLVANPSVMV